MGYRAWRVVLVATVLATAAPLAGAATPAEGQFRKGVAAFEAGDYRRAITRFQAAREAGLDSPALYHNLGVSYYRREQYAQAEAAFQKLARYPANRGLAHYNLGLVALAQDQRAQARDHFRSARSQARSADIRNLAEQRLDELATADRQSPRLSLFVSAGLGYDDNVTLTPDDIAGTSGTSDWFLQYLAAATAQAAGNPRDGFQIKASLVGTDYTDIDRFDQIYLRAGPEWDRPWGRWDTDLAAYADLVYLDGSLFERVFTGEAEGQRELGPDTTLRLGYRFSRIEGDSPYDYLTGNRHRISVEGRYRSRADVRLGYELEYNDREDRKTATRFASFSPTRHELFVEAGYPFGAWEAGAKAEYRHSRYHDANTDNDTGLDRVREDDRIRLEASLTRELPRDWQAFGEYRHTDNDANITAYDYTTNVYQLGLERYF